MSSAAAAAAAATAAAAAAAAAIAGVLAVCDNRGGQRCVIGCCCFCHRYLCRCHYCCLQADVDAYVAVGTDAVVVEL